MLTEQQMLIEKDDFEIRMSLLLDQNAEKWEAKMVEDTESLLEENLASQVVTLILIFMQTLYPLQ